MNIPVLQRGQSLHSNLRGEEELEKQLIPHLRRGRNSFLFPQGHHTCDGDPSGHVHGDSPEERMIQGPGEDARSQGIRGFFVDSNSSRNTPSFPSMRTRNPPDDRCFPDLSSARRRGERFWDYSLCHVLHGLASRARTQHLGFFPVQGSIKTMARQL